MHNDPPLFWMHIVKTAGTSLRMALERSDLRDRIAYIYADPPGVPLERFVAEAPERLAGTRLVFGHYRYGLHERLGVEGRYITILRNPVARALSVYRHHRRNKRSRWHAVARDGGIVGLFAEQPGRNSMTRVLATDLPAGRDSLDDAELLARAKEHLESSFVHVALVEDLHRDLPRLSAILGVPLTLRRDNADRRPIAPGALSAAERETIDRCFGVDVELYRFAEQLRAQQFLTDTAVDLHTPNADDTRGHWLRRRLAR